MKTLVVVIAILAFISCTSRHITSTDVRDSVRIETRYEVTYKTDTMYIEVPLQTAERTTRDTASHLETEYALSDARIRGDGTLYHILQTKPQHKPVSANIPVVRRDSIIYRDKNIETVKVQEVEKQLSWFQKTQIGGFWAAIILFVILYRKKIFALIVRCILRR